MEGIVQISLNAHEKPTNQDLTIVLTPDSSVMRYTYSVIRMGN